jgi:hypothetical protein
MYFGMKSYLKSNHYHTAKHSLNTCMVYHRNRAGKEMGGLGLTLTWPFREEDIPLT